jgi:DNA-binding GntR family transcriptional regulator
MVRGKVSDEVYSEIAGAIRDLRLPPGHAISETDLATWLHVSRTPVREAISRLVAHSLVRVVPQVGTSVSLIQLAEVREAQFIREHLEVAAFLDVCARSQVDLSALRDALTQQRAAHRSGDFNAFFEADEAFHSAIFAASGHSGAWNAVQNAKFHLDRIRRLASEPVSVRKLIAEHAAIHAALGRQDASGRELVVTHARRVLDYAPGLSARYPDYFED